MKILLIDTVYPDFLKSLPFDPNSTYEVELQKVLDRKFGTADFYSRNLKALGWEAVDVIANAYCLQGRWGLERYSLPAVPEAPSILEAQIQDYKPDVVFSQDLSLSIPRGHYLLAGQHSCPWAGDENVRKYDCLFSSFPHYIPRIEALGVRAVYNPLAFEPSVFEAIDAEWYTLPTNRLTDDYTIPSKERIYDCTFVGGVGTPSHWRYGMEVLNAVAEAIPTFRWWGYGAELLPDGPLKQKYYGSAFGVDMYEILLQSKICLNRHGEVAENFSNNMRMYEACGTGAMLLTEESSNIWDLFHGNEIQTYLTPQQAIMKIQYYLENDSQRAAIAARGQKRTLKDHTYAKRMKVVSDTLMDMLGVGVLNEARNEA